MSLFKVNRPFFDLNVQNTYGRLIQNGKKMNQRAIIRNMAMRRAIFPTIPTEIRFTYTKGAEYVRTVTEALRFVSRDEVIIDYVMRARVFFFFCWLI